MRTRSPFPGMDPWLEAYWGDVHSSLIAYARDVLQPQLPSHLRARVEEYVGVEARDEKQATVRAFVPDVSVLERESTPRSAASRIAPAEEAECPEIMVLPRRSEPITLRRLLIIDKFHGNRLITAIEFLSPSNKTGRGHDLYLEKQQELIEARVNLVEVDLIRSGDWSVAIDRDLVPKSKLGLYRAVVVRAAAPERCEYYPIPIYRRLPTLQIPLTPGVADVALPLQALLEKAYVNGGYGDLDYQQPPRPPLPPDIASWANSLLTE